MPFRVIVFDFDGTLVDSRALKRAAYDHVFADQPKCLESLPAILAELRHQSRYEIISAAVDHIPDLTPAERAAESERRTQAYSDWVEQAIVDRATDSPAGQLLPRWRANAALYVCSLTPVEPLRRILERLQWLAYFDGVAGYPVDKATLLRRAIAERGVRNDEALMVGDEDGDESAARQAGTAFFRIREMSDLTRIDELLTA
jgi:phosphoglycolate phosphatase-like HAD superfamily hydrolase